MNIRGASLLFTTGLLLASAAFCLGASDPLNEEPVATFEVKLKSFSAQPTLIALRDLNVLCMRLPVRDKLPGQIGDGHPQDRDVKLTCMLQFLTVMDQLTEDELPEHFHYQPGEPVKVVLPATPGLNMETDSIETDPAIIEYINFQARLRPMRKIWAVFEIPNFIKYDCRAAEKTHLQEIIRNQLKSDPKAADVMTLLLKEAGAR